MSNEETTSPIDAVVQTSLEIVAELSTVVPRLLQRGREQWSVVRALAEGLPCADLLKLGGRHESDGVAASADDSSLADVVPLRSGDADSAPAAPVKKAPAARKAPAKKAPAKKAPAARKAPAKKAAAKKAPAKKAPAARKAPAKKAPAKQAPAVRKAPATPAAATAPTPSATVAPGGLAIPDYDGLAASQVIPRLDGLTVAELDAVRRYEDSNRGRRTILGRIAQLQAG